MTKKEMFYEFIYKELDHAYGYAFSIVRNGVDAEDIVHESVVKALNSLYQLRDTKAMKSWFYRIISNTAFTYLKRNKKIIRLDTNILEDIGYVDKENISLSLKEYIYDLDIKYRTVIILRFFHEMTFKEMAETLDINENTAKTRLYKALELLKEEMEADEYERYTRGY